MITGALDLRGGRDQDGPRRSRPMRPLDVDREPGRASAVTTDTRLLITYTDCSRENDWTHTGALFGVDPGAAQGARDLGAVCDCPGRQRVAGHASGFCCRHLCV